MKKAILPLVILAVGVIVFILLIVTAPETDVVETAEKKWRVETITAEFETIAPQITLYGRVETPRDAVLKSALTADVTQVLVVEGTLVEAGQLLLKLDDSDAQLILQQRQAELAEIEARINSEHRRHKRDKELLEHQKHLLKLRERAVERFNRLQQKKLASQANLDDARANQKQQLVTLTQLQHDIDEHPHRLAQLNASRQRALALLNQARLDLERTLIRAPFNGRVASVSVSIGDRPRSGEALLRVYDLDHLEVRAQIPGRYIGQVKQMLHEQQNLGATATADGQKLRFSLDRLAGEVRRDSGGLDGLFVLDSATKNLALGTFVELQLALAELDKVLILPFSSLYGLDRVYRIDGEHMQAVKVERQGEIVRDKQRLLLVSSSEIQSGDQIVATQLPNAITGLSVEVAND